MVRLQDTIKNLHIPEINENCVVRFHKGNGYSYLKKSPYRKLIDKFDNQLVELKTLIGIPEINQPEWVVGKDGKVITFEMIWENEKVKTINLIVLDFDELFRKLDRNTVLTAYSRHWGYWGYNSESFSKFEKAIFGDVQIAPVFWKNFHEVHKEDVGWYNSNK